MNSGLFRNVFNKICLEMTEVLYMNKKDLAFNKLQWSICHKTTPNQTKPWNIKSRYHDTKGDKRKFKKEISKKNKKTYRNPNSPAEVRIIALL